jgi:phosphate transport system permease protein
MDKKQQATGQVFSGRTRQRRPKKSVLVKDRLARWIISLGGIGSILAVSMVGLFLFYVVLPLFLAPGLDEQNTLAAGDQPARVVYVGINEYATITWTLHRDGSLEVRSLADGRILQQAAIPAAELLTCWSFSIEGDRCAFGYSDGTVRVGTIGFSTRYLEPDEVPEDIRTIPVGSAAPWQQGILERTPENQFRFQELDLAIGDPVPLATSPLVRIDQSLGTTGPMLAALDGAGVLHMSSLRERRNLLTGEVTVTITGGSLDLRATGLLEESGIAPAHLLLTGLGDNAMLAWSDGRLIRIDTSDPEDLQPTGEADLVPEEGHRLTALCFQIGKASLVTGDDLGRIRVWFRVKDPDAENHDGTSLVLAHELPGLASVVSALSPSARMRSVVAGFADGTVALYHITSNQLIAQVDATADDEPLDFVTLGPRDDVILARAADVTRIWRIDAPHPETNWTSLMGKVWYEGYDEPAWVWQSSAATDSFEPKYSLMPLIFGTIKATFYSLLFGLPLAWFAALYTSEFLHPRAKARIKPVIELMASLPSVVLGFLAALVFAPFLEKLVPETLTAMLTVPFCFLAGAYLWQLVPKQRALLWEKYKFALMFVGLPAGLLLAGALGPGVERTLFAGDIVAWLDGQIGSGTGAWMFLLLPLSALTVFLINSQVVDGWLRRSDRDWSRLQFGLVDLARFAVSSVVVLILAWGCSGLLAAMGLDPRGSYVDTYVQRNALVVGVVMGFAIIPIIYTISEDALSAVPNHLRAASLGAGATPWQTAVRVIIPPAISGLFSAMMIGLGRAVGETMIVLMAAGNTPVMEWNIFNGFRTLSANIAVELPEAVQNSTHYRTLFLAALTLFIMTFILNTAAEAVRIRFRKKSLEL